MKEYIFKFEHDRLPEDYKKILSDKAYQCICNDMDLPDGVILEAINNIEL